MKKDYCSSFPEEIEGIKIGQTCCKKHDNEVGEKGNYNPITPHINFYNCLRGRGVSLKWTIIITFGGTIFSLIKYPLFVYKKYNYRKQK